MQEKAGNMTLAVLNPYIRLIRPKNWLKNIFVFVPLVFALALTDAAMLGDTLIIFTAFCMASSAVYIFNDIHDIELDRLHPVKRNRPLASGTVEIRTAAVFSFVLATAALGLAFYLNGLSALIVALYVAENLAYSAFLKHKPIYDCFCIAAGFVLRVYAGSFAIELFVTDWLFLTVVAMSLFMAFGKRRGEMLKVETNSQRAVLENYSLAFLNGVVFMCAGLAVIFYALWAMSRGMNMIYTVPMIIFIVCRYLLLVHGSDSHGDPTSVIFADRTLMAACVLYASVTICFLYTGDAIWVPK